MIITVDGLAASGKTSLMKALGERYKLPTLDTGLLYRKVGAAYLMPTKRDKILDSEAACATALTLWEDEDPYLQSELVGEAASIVGAMLHVRRSLLQFQLKFAHQAGGAVLAGRDTGTAIVPDADYKFYVTGTLEARAKRRAADIGLVSYAHVADGLAGRDARDPITPAIDAFVIDTTNMTVEKKLAAAFGYVDFCEAEKASHSENDKVLLASIAEMNKGRGEERKILS